MQTTIWRHLADVDSRYDAQKLLDQNESFEIWARTTHEMRRFRAYRFDAPGSILSADGQLTDLRRICQNVTIAVVGRESQGVNFPHRWKYSSFAKFVREELYKLDWGRVCMALSKPPDFDVVAAWVGE